MNQKQPDYKAKCPDCEYDIHAPGDTAKGEILSCGNCGLELEVKNVYANNKTIDLQELTIEGEDWGE